MTIVLNENEWAREMIDEGRMGSKPAETLRRVAKYYIDQNYSRRDTRKALDAFLLKCDPLASLPKWSDAMDRAVAKAARRSTVAIEYIPVTKTELARIGQLSGVRLKRLAFTLLCLSKYRNAVSPNADHWVSVGDGDIMRMANIATSVKAQCKLFKDLADSGIIQFSKIVDNTNVRVLFADCGEEVLRITDFRNLGNQYMKYCGGPYFDCQCCGAVTKYSDPVNGRKQKYCKECAAKIITRQKADYAMRKRKERRERAQIESNK